jgi:TPR repeat protein
MTWMQVASVLLYFFLTFDVCSQAPLDDKTARMINKAVSIGYQPGRGSIQSPDDIGKWIQKLAEGGDAESQHDFGLICEMTGKKEEAFRWFKKSANQDWAEAEYALARCYVLGIGCQKDSSKAAEIYKKSANKGNKDSQVMLGLMYKNGNGVTKNLNEARRYLKLASEQGDGAAKAYLLEVDSKSD